MRTVEQLLELARGQLPADCFAERRYTAIHAAVLFADLENSVMISSTIPAAEYDTLIDNFQQAMIELTTLFKDLQMPIGELSVVGDQLSIFLYDPDEVLRNFLLDGPIEITDEEREQLVQESRRHNAGLVFKALKAAILIKNKWLILPFNIDRARNQREPYGLGIGIHAGRVFYRDRSDGSRRIEGYAVNLAKRVESASRQGDFSHIMLSESAAHVIRGMVLGHTQLGQRIFFVKHNMPMELLKGIVKQMPIYELKFFHRVGFDTPGEVLEQYSALFAVDETNVWAYYQLADHYAWRLGDWEAMYLLAQRAFLAHPHDEKVLLDLAKYHYFHKGNLQQSREYCLMALDINDELDLVYEHLSSIADDLGNGEDTIRYCRKAVALSPGSAVNHMNLGLALQKHGNCDEAVHHFNEAFKIYPGYLTNEVVIEKLRELKLGGYITDDLKQTLDESDFAFDDYV